MKCDKCIKDYLLLKSKKLDDDFVDEAMHGFQKMINCHYKKFLIDVNCLREKFKKRSWNV